MYYMPNGMTQQTDNMNQEKNIRKKQIVYLGNTINELIIYW